MASRACWNCDTKAHMTTSDSLVTNRSIESGYVVAGLFTCDECNYPSLAFTTTDKVLSSSGRSNWLSENLDRWEPAHGTARDFPDVPQHIASAATEAMRCHSIAAYRASILLARSAIEATAKAKNITKGLLVTKIDELQKQDFIRAHIKAAAHEIRLFGNDMAHGDFVNAVTEEESEEILELMGEVLNEVFQSPAKIARRSEKRRATASDS